MRREWKNKEVQELQFYANEGLSIARVAKLLNRSWGSIAGAAARFGVKFSAEKPLRDRKPLEEIQANALARAARYRLKKREKNHQRRE